MLKPAVIFLISCLFFLSPLARLAANDIGAELLNKDLNAHPGKVFNLLYQLHNLSDTILIVKTTPALPQGIRLVMQPGDISMEPGAYFLQMVSIMISSTFQAGQTPLDILFKNAVSDSLLYQETIPLKIVEIENISFELTEINSYVMSGEEISASYLLRNTGNNIRKILIEPYNCLLLTPETVELAPGETSTVRIKAETSKGNTGTSVYAISVQAFLSENIKIRDFRSVTVFPVKESAADLFFRYPVTLSARYLSRGRDGKYNSGYQLEAQGDGYLDVDKKHKLEFMARGPNNYDLSFLGLYDEYYISYKNKNIESFAGSKSYSSTPLIESSRYGMGFENKFITNKGSEIGFFYVEPRFFRNIKNEMAAYADFRILKQNSIGVHHMIKTMSHTMEDARITSFTANLEPFFRTSAEVEYSLGTYLNEKDDAYRIYMNSQHKMISLSGSVIKSGKNYPGYYSNSTFYNGNINLNITKSLSMNFSAREDFSNASTDTLLNVSPFSKSYMAMINYRLNRFIDFRSYYIKYERKDRMPVRQFDYATESLNAWINHNFNKFSYQAGGEYGNTTNKLLSHGLDDRQNSFRLNLNAQYKPSYSFNIQGFTSYTNINSFIASSQKNWIWGFAAHGMLTQNLRTNFQVQNSFAIEDYHRNRNLFQFAMEYSFLKSHKISAQTFYTLFQGETAKPDYSASITYSVQIGSPLKKILEAGTLAGIITGIEGEPLKGIILNVNNKTAITGENGDFRFKTVMPGQHHLTIDRRNLAMDEILSIPAPLIVDVFSDRETKVNLNIVKASKLLGKFSIKVTESDIPTLSPQTQNLGNLVIEMRDDLETLRMRTNSDGRFEYAQLRPGKWILQVYKNSIDQQYVLNQEFFELILLPGETQKIDIELAPKTRTIVFKTSPVPLVALSDKKEETTAAILKPEDKTSENEGIWFSVQVAALSRQISLFPVFKNDNYEIFEIFTNGKYKYFSGRFNDILKARSHAEQVKTQIPGAFIVAFEGNKQISVREAMEKNTK
jgi:hypothetical protein